jgi:DNA-binding MarR family transcriptional regulator
MAPVTDTTRPRDQAECIVDFWRQDHPDLDPVPKLLAIRLRRIWHHFEREMRRELAANDVELSDLEVLMSLRAAPAYTKSAGALLRESVVTSGAITNRVGRLEARGWVRRDVDPSDRRQVLVSLTDVGRERIEHLMAVKTETEARFFSGLDRDAQLHLAEHLRTLVLAVEGPVTDDTEVGCAPLPFEAVTATPVSAGLP